jgi:hypothetical protein
VLNLVTATVTLWLLVNQSLPMFVLGKTVASIAINATGVTLTVRCALQTARREGLASAPSTRARPVAASLA